MSGNSGKAEINLGNVINSTLSEKRIVNKRKTPRRARKATGNVIKPMIADSSSCEDGFKVAAETHSNKSPTDIFNSIDNLQPDKSPDVSIANSGGSESCQCEKCGQRFCRRRFLVRHLNRNGCVQTKRAALNKLDAYLDFICEICHMQFKGDSKNTARVRE